MYTLFKYFKKYGNNLMVMMFVLLSLWVNAQAQVTVSASVFPPYSTKFSYYIDNPNKIQVFFVNTTAQPLDVYVQGNLTGDNGVEIKTDPAYHPPTPLTLQPGVPFYLTPDNLGDIFDADHLIFSGITEQELLDLKGLPEGNYYFCFRVYDFNTGMLLSDENSGCSNSMIIQYVDPPVILNPVCGDTVLSMGMQNVIVSWSVPVGAGPNVRYKFIMTEMHPADRNPNDAINAAVPPYFIEKDVSVPQVIITPADPPLMPGRSYAFQVQAYDPDNEVIFNNEGKSEACWFIYKQMKLPSFGFPDNNYAFVPMLNKPANNAEIKTKTPVFSWSYQGSTDKVHLRLVVVPVYFQQSFKKAVQENTPVFEENYKHIPEVFFPTSPLDFKNDAIYAWQVQVIDDSTGEYLKGSEIRSFQYKNPMGGNGGWGGWFSFSNVSGRLLYEFSDPGEYIGLPLKQAHVKLVVKYVLKYYEHMTNVGGEPSQGSLFIPDYVAEKLGFHDNNKVLATTITDDNGNFNFSFFYTDSTNIIVKKDYLFVESSGEFYNKYKGNLYRQFRLEFDPVFSPYYLNPDKNIIVQPDESANVGNVFAKVRSYGLVVTVKPQKNLEQQLTHLPIPNMIVKLLRKNRPYLVPDNEGKPKPLSLQIQSGFQVIAIDTTGENGQVTFRNLVRNVLPDDQYYIWVESDPERGAQNYASWIPVMIKHNFKDNACYGSEYQYPVFNDEVYAVPKKPEVAGKVVRSDGGLPVNGADVELYDNLFFLEKSWTTSANGKFLFKNLPVKYNSDGKIHAPTRHLYIEKKGFVSKRVPIQGGGLNYALLLGEKWHDYNIALDPASSLTGEVTNEQGNGVMAKVTLVGGLTVDTKMGMWNPLTNELRPCSFSLPAPTGQQQLIIDPTYFNANYFPDTVTVNVTRSGTDVGTIVLKEKTHKLHLTVYTVPPGENGFVLPGTEKRFPGALVTLKGQNGNLIEQKTTNYLGEAQFDFKNASSLFLLTIESKSPDVDVERRTVAITIPESKYWKTENVYVTKAAKVSGYVYVGKNDTPVENAHVFLEYSDSDGDLLDTYTDQNGYFVIHNVPVRNYQTFSAAKSMSNTIGDHVTVNVPKEGLSNLTFNLKVYEDMDITHLLGFPIEVTSLVKSGGDVLISGKIIKLDSLDNSLFSTDKKYIGFSNLAIVKGAETSMMFGKSVPVALPKQLPLKTDLNSFNVKVYNHFDGVLNDSLNGITVRKISEKKGVMAGKVFIPVDNFNIPQGNLNFDQNKLFLKSASGDEMVLPVLTSDKSKPFNAVAGIPVVSAKNKDVRYKLFGYNAVAKKGNSFLSGNELKLETVLHTNIPNMIPSDLALNIGKVKIKRDALEPVSGGADNPVSFKLGKWTMTGNQWRLNGYLNIEKGVLKTGIVDVPVTEMLVKQNVLSQGKFDLKNMKLGGSVPLHITGNAVLNYNNAENYWFLFVGKGDHEYSSYLSDLPGMVPGEKIKINNFSLTSTGKQDFSPVYGQKSVKIYKVGKLSANSIESFRDYVEIKGLSFDIPGMSQITSIRYLKGDDGQPRFKLVPFVLNLKSKGVNMDFGVNEEQAKTQKLDDHGFVAYGKTYEPGKFELKTWLYHTGDSTSIWVETSPWQTLPIGGNKTYLSKVTGFMKVQNHAWSNFRFAGDLTGTKGVTDDKKRMDFIVKGEIEASGQEISLKNVDTPFGNMSWTYEFENSRLIGNLSFDSNIGGTRIKGDAQTLIDPDGWYFVASGKTQIPGLGPANAGILFGDYPYLTRGIKDIFAANSYNKHLPASFDSQVSGFLFSGAIAIPVLVPSIKLDLYIFEAGLGIDAGGDARLWMNFDGSGNEYGIGFLGFVHAYADLPPLPTCTQVDADAHLEMGTEGVYKRPQGTFTLNGCNGFSFKAKVKQLTPTVVVGCVEPVIIDKNLSFGFKANMSLDSDGNKSFKFSLGSCSGN